MRILCLFTLLFSTDIFAQSIDCKQSFNISQIEGARAAHFFNMARTAASEEIDVHYYNCEWRVDPSVRRIDGSVAVHFKARQSLSTVILDLVDDLVIDSVKRGNLHLSFSRPDSAVEIQLASPLNAGAFDSVRIFYGGIPPTTGFGSFIQSSHSGTPVLWSLSEPYGSMDWWPCKNGLDDKADSIDITLIHPDIYKASSNGMLQREVSLPGNMMQTEWKHRYPIASYLVAFAVTNYVVFENSVQLGSVDLPMVTYCYPESETLFQTNLQPVLDQLKLFHDSIAPYPFINEKYGHTQFGWGGGMEHQTNSFIVVPDERLMAHELAHQWFGDMVTTGSWSDIWLNEGFATHFAAYYMEKAYPASSIPNRRAVVNDITSQPGGKLKVDDTTDVGRIFSGRLSYNKGSHLVYMLRFKLGEEVFFEGIRNYLNDPALKYGFARTPNLRAHLEAASGQDLGTFFQQWYEGEGYPSYHVDWTPIGASLVEIKLSQTTSHPSVSFFEMPVPLLFKNSFQEKIVRVDAITNNQSFRVNLGFIPDTVIVDPEYWLISRNNTSEKIPYAGTGIAGIDVYPNPATAPVSIFLHDIAGESVQLTLYNSVGQLIWKNTQPLADSTAYFQFNMNNLARGVYYLRARSNRGNVLVKKILK